MNKQTRTERRIKKIKENEEYIIWLDNYANTHPLFTNDQHLYSRNVMEDEEKENTESLEELYKIIQKYAEDNYLAAEKDEFGFYYQITYNSNFYKIGFMDIDELIYYCSKFYPNNTENIIDFMNILQNKKTVNTDIIGLKMQKLKIIIDELSLIMPEEAIDKEIKKMYKKHI